MTADLIIVFAAAFSAGAINSIAGGGTLLSFPALVSMGRDPIIANATNAVALWPGSLAAMVGFRRELRSAEPTAFALLLPSVAGGVLGAWLLLRTPSPTFAAIVPWLILFATFMFAFQERIGGVLGGRGVPGTMRKWLLGACGFQLLVATYGGYFGAGMGIVMLAALGLLGVRDIYAANGLKNLFAVATNGVAAVYFALSGAVDWRDAAVMTVAAVAGGFGGAAMARRAGRRIVERAVVVIGLTAAVAMLTVRLGAGPA
jgi:hypothetical protein